MAFFNHLHNRLAILLCIFGIFLMFTIKFSIWWFIGSIICFIILLFLTKDKNLLKFLIPTLLILIFLSIIFKLF